MRTESIAALLDAYREGAHGTSATDSLVANKWQQIMHNCYTKLCGTSEGKAGIMSFMDDLNPHVRCWAAAHSLQWHVQRAKAALIKLQESGGPCSFDAEMVLEEYDNGTLNFDY